MIAQPSDKTDAEARTCPLLSAPVGYLAQAPERTVAATTPESVRVAEVAMSLVVHRQLDIAVPAIAGRPRRADQQIRISLRRPTCPPQVVLAVSDSDSDLDGAARERDPSWQR